MLNSIRLKLLMMIVFVAMIFFYSFTANAMTLQERQNLITQIQGQIAQLTIRLQQMVSQQSLTQDWCHTFNTNLGYVNSGSIEVANLHIALQKQGISYGRDGINEYGTDTMLAVRQFQTKYNIIPSTGYFGLNTKIKMNTLYGCKISLPLTVTSPATPSQTTPPPAVVTPPPAVVTPPPAVVTPPPAVVTPPPATNSNQITNSDEASTVAHSTTSSILANRAEYKTDESMNLKSSKPGSSYGPDFYGKTIVDNSENLYLIGTFKENLTIGNTVYQSSQRRDENMTLTNNLLGIVNDGLAGLQGMKVVYGSDGVIAKKNSQGEWQWVKTIEAKTFEAREPGIDLALPKSSSIDILFSDQDNEGNTYIGGMFVGQINFNSQINLTSYIKYDTYRGCTDCIPFTGNSMNREPFIAKINSNGEWQWAKKLANKDFNPDINPDYKLTYPSWNRGIARLDNLKILGNKIIFTAEAIDSVSLDNILLLKNTSYALLGELDLSGTLIKIKEIKNLSYKGLKDTFGGIISQIDTNGNIYFIDENISKFNPDGNLIWTKELDKKIYWLDSALKSYLGTSILDLENNIYLVGKYKDSINLLNTSLPKHPKANNNESGFIAKIDQNGNLVWSKNFYDKNTILNVQVYGNKLYLAGDIISYDDVNYGSYSYFGDFTVSSYGGLSRYGSPSANKDLFVVTIDLNNGNFISADMFGDENSSSLKSVFVKNNKVYLLGIETDNRFSMNDYDAPMKLFVWTK